MQQQIQHAIRVTIVAFVLVLAGALAPGASASAQGSVGRAGGCHAWPAVFRPVLSILSEGTVLVALPTYLPTFPHRVYAHANVLQPPLTYDAALSTRAGTGWPVPSGTTLLAIHGVAGKHGTSPRETRQVAGGKTIGLVHATHKLSAVWYDRAANVTYTVAVPISLGKQTLLRVAGSLTTGVLRAAPITAGQSASGFNACP